MRVSSTSRSPRLHLAGGGVERDVGEAEHAVGVAVDRSPEEGTDAREQLLERERLDKVVVRPGVEAGDAIRDRVACRQHEDRRPIPVAAEPPADRDAVELGHQDVEHDELRALTLHRPQRRGTVLGGDDLVAVEGQGTRDGRPDGRLVVYDEDPHRSSLAAQPERFVKGCVRRR